MARTRMLSPQFFLHDGLYDAEKRSGLPLRLAYAGIWCQTDRRGVFEWRPRVLQSAIMPYDRDVDFAAVLSALKEAGFVETFTVDDREYGWIRRFAKWQTFHFRESTKFPAPPGWEDAEPRASPGPALGEPGASPTASASVTASVTASASASVVSSSSEDDDDLLLLLTAANDGIAQGYVGQERKAITANSAGSGQCVSELRRAGVDITFAADAIRTYAATAPSEQPPRSLTYFTEHVKERWMIEQAREAMRAYTPPHDPKPRRPLTDEEQRTMERFNNRRREIGLAK